MLNSLSATPMDPIIQLAMDCRLDQRPDKIDLGIGVYKDEHGQTPIMAAIKSAEQRLWQEQQSKSYVGMAGDEQYNSLMSQLLLGEQSPVLARTAAVQTAGASGALKLVADCIKKAEPDACVWLSNPSYANHAPIMRAAGLRVAHYPYFDSQSHLVDETAMLAQVAQLGPKDVLLLHGSCHNPTGADISFAAWQRITELCLQKGFLPFVDMAYQGFGQGLEQDAAGLRYLAERVPELFCVSSCSKNFGLYRERTGLALVLTQSASQSMAVKSRLMEAARSTYTMPPDHGASLVRLVLSDAQLKQQWLDELQQMQARISQLRHGLAQALTHAGCQKDLNFITQHQGMFSVLSLTEQQCLELKNQFGLYIVNGGRINVAAINSQQLARIGELLAPMLG